MDATGPEDRDQLSAYRAKRSLGITPEPAGAVGAQDGSLFVVHKHAASHLHWDPGIRWKVLRPPLGPRPDDSA
jgi:hypothetical protein